MIDLVFGLIAVAVGGVVILAWRWIHHEHQEARVRRAQEADQQTRGLADWPSMVTPPATTGWSVPQPLHVPRPTYCPAVLALGVMWMAWGAVSSRLLSLAGIATCILALTLWIREMLHGQQTERSTDG